MEGRLAPPLVHAGRRRNLTAADAARASPDRALLLRRGKGGEGRRRRPG
jgi:hypothetical protein